MKNKFNGHYASASIRTNRRWRARRRGFFTLGNKKTHKDLKTKLLASSTGSLNDGVVRSCRQNSTISEQREASPQ
jgi:hypothetical protein